MNNLKSLINQRQQKLQARNLLKKQIAEAKHIQSNGNADALKTVEAKIAELDLQIKQMILKLHKEDPDTSRWLPHWLVMIENYNLPCLKKELQATEEIIKAQKSNLIFQNNLEKIRESNPDYYNKLTEVQYIKRNILTELITNLRTDRR